MIILNMGIPRSGTVWAFNVFRAVWQVAGVQFRTEQWNSESDVKCRLSGISAAEHILIHTHDLTPDVELLARRPGVRSFFSYRDPRDVVVSQMKLHDVSFDIAVRMTEFAYQNLPCAMTLPGIMFLPYDHIVAHAPAVIFQMAARVDILLSHQMVDKIALSNNLERNRRTMDLLNRGTAATGGSGIESLNTGVREIRYCKASLITDRHIQSGRTGRWRDELSADQQQHVCGVFAPVIKSLGFDAYEFATSQPRAKAA